MPGFALSIPPAVKSSRSRCKDECLGIALRLKLDAHAQPMLLVSRYYLTQLWDITKEESVQRQMVPGGASSVFPTAGGVLAVARSGDRTTRFWDPAGGSLRGVLLEEGDCIVAISTGGDVKYDAAEKPTNLIAILETTQGQKTISLEEWPRNMAGKIMPES